MQPNINRYILKKKKVWEMNRRKRAKGRTGNQVEMNGEEGMLGNGIGMNGPKIEASVPEARLGGKTESMMGNERGGPTATVPLNR